MTIEDRIQQQRREDFLEEQRKNALRAYLENAKLRNSKIDPRHSSLWDNLIPPLRGRCYETVFYVDTFMAGLNLRGKDPRDAVERLGYVLDENHEVRMETSYVETDDPFVSRQTCTPLMGFIAYSGESM